MHQSNLIGATSATNEAARCEFEARRSLTSTSKPATSGNMGATFSAHREAYCSIQRELESVSRIVGCHHPTHSHAPNLRQHSHNEKVTRDLHEEKTRHGNITIADNVHQTFRSTWNFQHRGPQSLETRLEGISRKCAVSVNAIEIVMSGKCVDRSPQVPLAATSDCE